MTQEVPVVRRAVAGAILAVALLAAVVLQVTVVNRLPLPGGSAPDLVLLLVAAIAVTTGPLSGALAGFCGGLALDVAPPAAHYAGEYALVFCLVGYGAARVVRAIWDKTGQCAPLTALTVMLMAVAAGEAGKAALGIAVADPDVTTAAVSRVLPVAVLYDLVLAPVAYWLVARVTRGAVAWRALPERAPAPDFGAVRTAAVFRAAAVGAAPGLRLSGTGKDYLVPVPPRTVPRLRLARATAPARGAARAAAPRQAKINFAGDSPVHTRRPAADVRTPGKNWLRSATVARAAGRKPRTPSRGWLRAGQAGRAGYLAAGRARGTGRRRAAARPRRFAQGTAGTASAARSPLAARPARSPAEALAARSAPSGLSALAGPGTPLAGRRSPSSGWLTGSGTAMRPLPRKRAPRSGWLGSGRPRTVIGSGVPGRGAVPRRSRARGNWYHAAPSGAWLRRSRHPWRKRSQRLLRLVGVGR